MKEWLVQLEAIHMYKWVVSAETGKEAARKTGKGAASKFGDE